MNKLYRIERRVFLNGVELCDRSFRERPLHYSEVPESVSFEFTNFDEVWNMSLLCCSRGKTKIFKKKYILGYLNYRGETMRVSDKDFETYVVEMNVNTYEDDCYTMTELAKLLSVTDFVNWCKDHNLNICSTNHRSKV